MVEETVMVAPDIKLPQDGQIDDPTSLFSKISFQRPRRAQWDRAMALGRREFFLRAR